ncbi:hypothetical protein AYO38_02835 [bacterium SCGC AG-212-C10]|nr:hypothetical protein AYO38_02835 [bacterium SCGC AG-212-C10]
MKSRTYLAGGAVTGLALIAVVIGVVASRGPARAGPEKDGDSGGILAITSDDYGKAVAFGVGDVFVVRLDERYDWQLTFGDPSLFEAVPTFAADGQGTFKA